jgi:signal transduction histidine kinase
VLEALQNVGKYANAKHVTVHLREVEDHVAFEIRDDGVGFDPNLVAGGTGLRGMADRVEAVGGTFELKSAPGEGTTISGRVPIGADPVSGGPAASRG